MDVGCGECGHKTNEGFLNESGSRKQVGASYWPAHDVIDVHKSPLSADLCSQESTVSRPMFTRVHCRQTYVHKSPLSADLYAIAGHEFPIVTEHFECQYDCPELLMHHCVSCYLAPALIHNNDTRGGQ